MAQLKKRRGRPLKPASPGERASLGLRVSGDLKRRLDESAKKAGRTQGQEAELRLERSFEADRVFEQTMELAYGRKPAALLALIGHVMRSVGGTNATLSTNHLGTDWFGDAFAYGQVERAVAEVFAAYRPSGDPKRMARGDIADPAGWLDNGKAFAELMIDVVDQAAIDQFSQAEFIRDRLGPSATDRPKRWTRATKKGSKS